MNIVAAIDIGSNAIRTLISKVENDGSMIILKKIRSPLRLGSDVFGQGYISEEKRYKINEIFVSINAQLIKYQVQKIRACATSAMREAKNGQLIINQIKENSGISIELIDGDQEAKLVHDAVKTDLHLENKLAIIIDIGGGSTEFSISQSGKLIACKSFPIGSVRLLEHQDYDHLSSKILAELSEAQLFINRILSGRKPDILIGTGGNFRRLGKINKKISGKLFENYISSEEIEKIHFELYKMSHEERVNKFDLSDDRADVIVPASLLIKKIAKIFEAPGIYLPKVGLKEGILLSLR